MLYDIQKNPGSQCCYKDDFFVDEHQLFVVSHLPAQVKKRAAH